MAPTAITRQEPERMRNFFRLGPLQSLREEMQDFFAQVTGDDETFWPFSRVSPRLDISETDQAVEVRMDLPGIKPEEIDVQLNANTLTISGERRESRTYHRVERRMGTFSRSISLPCPVKEDSIDARYKDGILTVSLPKMEECKSQKFTVKTLKVPWPAPQAAIATSQRGRHCVFNKAGNRSGTLNRVRNWPLGALSNNIWS